MNFTPELAALIFIILLYFFIGIYFLLGKSKRDLSDSILAIYFLLGFADFLIYTLNFQEIIDFKSKQQYLLMRIVTIQLLYFFILSKGQSNFSFSKINKIHFLVPLLAFIVPSITSDSKILLVCMEVTKFTYYALMIKFILRFRKSRSQQFSTTTGYDISWASWILVVVLVYSFFPFAWNIAINFFNANVDSTNLRMMAACTVILHLLAILWIAITRANKVNPIDTAEIKYAGSSLTESQKARDFDNLLNTMKSEELFLNPELKLADVSGIVGINPKHLSQIINEKSGKNFYEFVNAYRIEYTKNLLKNTTSKEMNITQVMYESGFNSKSSFNTMFKKNTGFTPSIYRKQAAN